MLIICTKHGIYIEIEVTKYSKKIMVILTLAMVTSVASFIYEVSIGCTTSSGSTGNRVVDKQALERKYY